MSTEPVLVAVTEDHIRRGIPGSAESCPVALALAEATGLEPGEVLVGDDWFYIDSDRTGLARRGYATPEGMAGFIRDFDDEGRESAPWPTTFRLALERVDAPTPMEVVP